MAGVDEFDGVKSSAVAKWWRGGGVEWREGVMKFGVATVASARWRETSTAAMASHNQYGGAQRVASVSSEMRCRAAASPPRCASRAAQYHSLISRCKITALVPQSATDKRRRGAALARKNAEAVAAKWRKLASKRRKA